MEEMLTKETQKKKINKTNVRKKEMQKTYKHTHKCNEQIQIFLNTEKKLNSKGFQNKSSLFT